MYPGDEREGLREARRKFADFVDAQYAAPEPDYEERVVRAFVRGRRDTADHTTIDFERRVARAMAAARESAPGSTVAPDAIKAIIVGVLDDTGYCLCRTPCGGMTCQKCEAWGTLAERLARIV